MTPLGIYTYITVVGARLEISLADLRLLLLRGVQNDVQCCSFCFPLTKEVCFCSDSSKLVMLVTLSFVNKEMEPPQLQKQTDWMTILQIENAFVCHFIKK